MAADEEFFLTTAGEYDALADPRSCRSVRILRDAVGSAHILVRIEPTLTEQRLDPPAYDLQEVILSPHYAGTTVTPVSEWPLQVYVGRALGGTDWHRQTLD